MKAEKGSSVGKGLKYGSLGGLAVTAFASAASVINPVAAAALITYNAGTFYLGTQLDNDAAEL